MAQDVRDGCTTFELCGDFTARIKVDKAARATQKTIDAQHAEVFTPEAIGALQDQVKVFYEIKAAKEAR